MEQEVNIQLKSFPLIHSIRLYVISLVSVKSINHNHNHNNNRLSLNLYVREYKRRIKKVQFILERSKKLRIVCAECSEC